MNKVNAWSFVSLCFGVQPTVRTSGVVDIPLYNFKIRLYPRNQFVQSDTKHLKAPHYYRCIITGVLLQVFMLHISTGVLFQVFMLHIITGGSQWTLEDTIELKNIDIPDLKVEIDLSLIFNNELSGINGVDLSSPSSRLSPSGASIPSIVRTTSVPSVATVQSVRRHLSTKNTSTAPQLRLRHLIHLDWVSTEDGSHVLTVGIGPQVLLYAAVSSETVAAMIREDQDRIVTKASGTTGPPSRGILQKTKSMAVNAAVVQVQLMITVRECH